MTTDPPKKSNIGRPKGSSSRAQALLCKAQKHIAEKLGVQNFDPVIFLLEVAADKEQEMSLRVQAAAKATPYLHSTLRSIEVKGDSEEPININLSSSKERLAHMLETVQKITFEEVILEAEFSEETETKNTLP